MKTNINNMSGDKLKLVIQSLTNDVEYFCYSHTPGEIEGAEAPGTKFIVIKLNDQWIKVNLDSDFTWMSLKLINNRFSMSSLSKEEPSSVHYKQPYLFAMSESLGLTPIHSALSSVSTFINNDKEYKKEPYGTKAMASFNDTFEGVL